jgi:PAS domain S-box-containing protein
MNLSFTPKVMLVDDSKWELELFDSMLHDECLVEKQHDARKTLDRAKSLQPHLIVLDMIMPGIEGIDILKQLKVDEQTKHIPVIMVTAYSSNEERVVSCIELGACDYLFKPVSEEILRAKISRAIQMQHTENSLRNSLAYNNHLMDAIRSIIIGVDVHKCVSYWNRSAAVCFGLDASEVIGKPISEVDIGWDWSKVSHNVDLCLHKGLHDNRFDIDYRCRQSGSRILSICITPFIDIGSNDGEYLILADDVTEVKIQQSYDHQTERLQSIGQLASGIAHEINTPIQYVGDNTHFLQESFQELLEVIGGARSLAKQVDCNETAADFQTGLTKLCDNYDYDYLVDNVPKAISQTLEGIERVTTIVKAMKDFSHPGSEQKDPTDINRAINSTITVARNVWKYVADMETDFDPNMGEYNCFTGPLNEVVLNIIVNAAHAISAVVENDENKKGVIRVSTKRFESYGEIRIKDSGTGIPKHVQEKIFDPFFTTKEVGKGTGQGLSLCHNIIVEQHGGELFFESREGEGTTFVIHLPTDHQDCEE